MLIYIQTLKEVILTLMCFNLSSSGKKKQGLESRWHLDGVLIAVRAQHLLPRLPQVNHWKWRLFSCNSWLEMYISASTCSFIYRGNYSFLFFFLFNSALLHFHLCLQQWKQTGDLCVRLILSWIDVQPSRDSRHVVMGPVFGGQSRS